MVGWMLHHKLCDEAVAVLVGYACYLRPGELTSLLRKQLVLPNPAAGPLYQRFGLVLHPLESGVPGKTGVDDDSATIDQLDAPSPALSMIAARG
eukprot:4329986-Alexandrium_andersonii.AAC.1